MKTYTSNEAKTKFGEVIMASQRAPVSVTKNGKPAVVVVSQQDYDAMVEAAAVATSQARFPEPQAEVLRRLINHSEERMSKGHYTLFSGSLSEAMQRYEEKGGNA